jgi:hypothetical protein
VRSTTVDFLTVSPRGRRLRLGPSTGILYSTNDKHGCILAIVPIYFFMRISGTNANGGGGVEQNDNEFISLDKISTLSSSSASYCAMTHTSHK